MLGYIKYRRGFAFVPPRPENLGPSEPRRQIGEIRLLREIVAIATRLQARTPKRSAFRNRTFRRNVPRKNPQRPRIQNLPIAL